MADREATPGLSCDLFHTNSLCMCVWMYVCLHVFVCMYVTSNIRVFLFQVAYKMKNAFPMWFVRVHVYDMCVYDCVHVCVCVCVRGKWLHIYVL